MSRYVCRFGHVSNQHAGKVHEVGCPYVRSSYGYIESTSLVEALGTFRSKFGAEVELCKFCRRRVQARKSLALTG